MLNSQNNIDEFADVNGLRVRFRRYGSGNDVLLIMHGWGCNVDTVESIARAAAPCCSVVSIDFPGFGSSNEPHETWGVERYTDFVEDFCRAINIRPTVLLGHSFGGRVGIVYASRHPEVSKLVLVDSAGVKPKRPLSYYYKVYKFKAAKFLIRTFLPRKRADRAIEQLRAGRGSADYNSASPRMKAILSRVVNEDLQHLMPSIKASTLLIWGDKDTATPLADARVMDSLIPDSGLVTFAGCGHYSFLDNPVQFRAVLQSFLK